jgi:ATP-dependent Clp protease ATP-binding subunit ClpA
MLDSVKKMAEAKGVKLYIKPELINELVAKGFNPEWGARPLARVIENTVETYMAVKFLSKEIKMGDTVYLGPEILTDPNLSVT